MSIQIVHFPIIIFFLNFVYLTTTTPKLQTRIQYIKLAKYT